MKYQFRFSLFKGKGREEGKRRRRVTYISRNAIFHVGLSDGGGGVGSARRLVARGLETWLEGRFTWMQIGHTSISISIFPSDRLSRGRERKGMEGRRERDTFDASIEQRCFNLFVFGWFHWIYCFFLFFLFFLVGEIEDWDLFYRLRRNCINYIGWNENGRVK